MRKFYLFQNIVNGWNNSEWSYILKPIKLSVSEKILIKLFLNGHTNLCISRYALPVLCVLCDIHSDIKWENCKYISDLKISTHKSAVMLGKH